MKKLAPFVLVAALQLGAAEARAQTMIEATGEVGYTRADVNDWLGVGVFNPSRTNYGGSGLVLFGRRGAGGMMYGAEVGYRRLIGYEHVDQGTRLSDSVFGVRALLLTRFWFAEGAWFGEAGAGIERLSAAEAVSAATDPTIVLGAGIPLGLTDSWSVITKVRGSVVFDSGSPIATIAVFAGMSLSLGG